MKNNPNIRLGQIPQTESKSVLRLLFWILTGLLVVFPFSISAQFIRINISIPAKIGLSDLESFDMSPINESYLGLQEMEGLYILTITSAENLQIMASITHSDSLHNELGEAFKFTVTMGFRNDGKSIPQKGGSSSLLRFPMSDSGLLIEQMKGLPQLLNAYLFIYANVEQAKNIKTTYMGDINLTIEYN